MTTTWATWPLCKVLPLIGFSDGFKSMFQEGRIDFKIIRILKLFESILKFRPARPLMTAPISFQDFQEYQEFQVFQEIATHFKSVSRDSKIYQQF